MEAVIPDKVKSHKSYPYIRDGLRALQFIFAVVNLGLFASYIVRTSVRISSSSGAVVGLLSAGIVFSVAATVIKCTKLGTKWRTTLIILALDLIFVAAFIAVSVLTARARTRPAGSGGRCNAPPSTNDNDNDNDDDEDTDRSGCTLTSACMALSILSTIAHSASSLIGQGKQTAHAGKIEKPWSSS